MATSSIVSGISIPQNVYQKFIDMQADSVSINIVQHNTNGVIEYEAIAVATFNDTSLPSFSAVICPKPCLQVNLPIGS